MNTNDRAILLTFNLICILLLLYSVILTFGYAHQLIETAAGKSVLLFFTAFYLVRIYCEFAYFGFQMPGSIIIIAICLIPAVCFGVPVFVTSNTMTRKITQMDIPAKSLLFPGHEKYDYIDSFGCVFDDTQNAIGIDDVAEAFTQPLPTWVAALMNLRNRIVSPFGLKTSKKSYGRIHSVEFIPGNRIGFFNVYNRTANEVILGEDDKHLKFRVSLFLGHHESDPLKKIVAVTTVVKYNNWIGPVYFFFVKPFHKRIVPAMLEKDFSRFI